MIRRIYLRLSTYMDATSRRRGRQIRVYRSLRYEIKYQKWWTSYMLNVIKGQPWPASLQRRRSRLVHLACRAYIKTRRPIVLDRRGLPLMGLLAIPSALLFLIVESISLGASAAVYFATLPVFASIPCGRRPSLRDLLPWQLTQAAAALYVGVWIVDAPIVLTVSQALRGQAASASEAMQVGFLVIGPLLTLYFFAVVALTAWIDAVARLSRLRRVGRAGAAINLMKAATRLEWTYGLQNVDQIKAVDAHLREAAYCVRYGMPYNQRLSSTPLRDEYRSRCDEIARHIESYSYELHAPADGDMSSLFQQLMDDSFALLERRDAGITGVKPGDLSRRLAKRALSAFRLTIVASIPAAALALSNHFALAIPQPIYNAAVLFSILWAVVTLLHLLDASAPSRIQTVHSLSSLLTQPTDEHRRA